MGLNDLLTRAELWTGQEMNKALWDAAEYNHLLDARIFVI
jgi:hypothetical protein